jgi:hypothetical protein
VKFCAPVANWTAKVSSAPVQERIVCFTTSYVTHCDAVSRAARAAAGDVPRHSPDRPSDLRMAVVTLSWLAFGWQSAACRRVFTCMMTHRMSTTTSLCN